MTPNAVAHTNSCGPCTKWGILTHTAGINVIGTTAEDARQRADECRRRFALARTASSTRVAGIYSTKLGVLVRPRLDALTAKLVAGLNAEAARAGVALTTHRVGSMFTAFFTSGPVVDYASAKRSSTAAFGQFFHTLLDQGIYFPPSAVRGGICFNRPYRERY